MCSKFVTELGAILLSFITISVFVFVCYDNESNMNVICDFIFKHFYLISTY